MLGTLRDQLLYPAWSDTISSYAGQNGAESNGSHGSQEQEQAKALTHGSAGASVQQEVPSDSDMIKALQQVTLASIQTA